MTKLKWRLSKLPTPEEVRELVKDQILTKEEAREILFNPENEVDTEALEAEIKFLRQLVERLSTSKSQIIETIRYVERPYVNTPWYPRYQVWCSAGDNLYAGVNSINLAANSSVMALANNTDLSSMSVVTGSNGVVETTSFSEIKTF
ncbi:MAG: hypothetical protein V4509_04625 [Patescibacteria group bacterium]